MSSTERAPEPTMDEILASIRRIISDDEATPVVDPRPAAPSPGASTPARTDPFAPGRTNYAPPAEEEDDILDLTKVLAEGSYGRDLEPASPFTDAASVQPKPNLGPVHDGDGAAELQRAMAEVASAIDHAEAQDAALLADAEFEIDDTSAIASPTTMAPPAVPEAMPRRDSLFANPRSVDPRAMAWDDESAQTEDTPHEPKASALQRVVSDAWPAEMAAEEGEPPRDEPAAAPAQAVIDDMAAGAQASPPPPPASFMASAPNGLSGDYVEAASSGAKSFEDSVKDMLRPMLRQWLDDNMPRILESAMREELNSKHPAPQRH